MYNSAWVLQEAVAYNDTFTWPVEANRAEPTLEYALTEQAINNGVNWVSGFYGIVDTRTEN